MFSHSRYMPRNNGFIRLWQRIGATLLWYPFDYWAIGVSGYALDSGPTTESQR